MCFQAIVIYKPSHKCFVAQNITIIFFLSGPKAINDKPFWVLISSPRSFSFESQSLGNRAFKKVKSSVELTLKVSGQLLHCAPSNGVIIFTMMGKWILLSYCVQHRNTERLSNGKCHSRDAELSHSLNSSSVWWHWFFFFFFFHKNYYQKHFLIFRCREVFKTVLDNQKKPVSITGEYFQEHNSSPRDKRILKTDSLRVCCLECLMLKKRTVSACTLGMNYVVDNHEHSFVCFLRKI